MNFKVHVILNTINNAKKVPFRRFRGFKSHHFICPNDQIYTIRHGGNGQVSVLSLFLDFKQVPQASISPPTSTIFFQLFIHVEFQVCQSFALHRLPIRKSFTSRPCFFAVTANRKAFHAFSYSFVSRIILNFKFRNLFFCKTQIL